MKHETFTPFFLATLALTCCNRTGDKIPPNVILIMADDMGYECLGCYGSTSYRTPVLDSLASQGMLFGQCHSQPLSTPSRVKLMTGLYNYRNYDYFDHLANGQYTFGNLMREAGYSTCIAGKWQLNGISYKEEIPYWNDTTRTHKFGFDEYCLWQYTKARSEGERYSKPLIEQNGRILATGQDDYGPDIFADYILDFIERKKDQPFFVYYPMALVHDPFVPTPLSDDWEAAENRYKKDTAYFKDMVSYADRNVGRIVNKLKELDLGKNTLLIFTGDNGTATAIYSRTKTGIIRGGKGNTKDAGTHVPLILCWPAYVEKGSVYDGLIEFSDFFATLADIAGKEVECDGHSFYRLLTGSGYEPRKTLSVHYDPRWGNNSVNRNQFVRTLEHKLYLDGRFFDLSDDILETRPLNTDSLSVKERESYVFLKKELDRHPVWVKF
ncbi:MAG TPA: sulfatase-like hydrolase/transferase [Bacteroidales bacterium]|nr:sulfatase-like hydrolase/transferase [Bacteroidales bacterium]HPF03790.1 sulfatase-like hydrolase/transferase [Bacteroidales bacterium]HPJ60056.1 sulfatase-like hydrolase/transferase [Bacteroidales bacterium]HPR11740.1 sulfatase-like hydrolase/transferase [Bacteroidales bacterium]HRW85452.1 sulfatase-like hydrolase/transferase [Bacteroidales bacterium]